MSRLHMSSEIRKEPEGKNPTVPELSGLVAGDSAICGRLGGPNSAIAACGWGPLKGFN